MGGFINLPNCTNSKLSQLCVAYDMIKVSVRCLEALNKGLSAINMEAFNSDHYDEAI